MQLLSFRHKVTIVYTKKRFSYTSESRLVSVSYFLQINTSINTVPQVLRLRFLSQILKSPYSKYQFFFQKTSLMHQKIGQFKELHTISPVEYSNRK